MSNTFVFGQVCPNLSQVFYTSPLSRATVNLKPIVPGHVLVIPKRRTLKFSELTPEEVSDLWMTVQKIGSVIERHYSATSLTFALQDGHEAGQTIKHVHVHIIPRRSRDFDEVYSMLESDRKARTEEEMEKEAKELKSYFV
eukprot:TRINITY_DN13894_c0_g1_i1.p1 TRINITY_DN13894_c0_g1~~TRINITY_DN13894_c0_g1_i1.p1  ORF type:complete len:141 (-),score=26.06 TRINITY_DN13894_c0_g1_i1:23-445(-)